MRSTKLQADIINGVYIVQEFEEGTIILSVDDFLSSLRSCEDDEIIGAEFSDDQLDKVQDEYGIH